MTAKENNRITLSRRDFLSSVTGMTMTLATSGAIASTAPTAAPTAISSPTTGPDRELSFYNLHTGEKLSTTFWSDGKYLDDSIEQINWILRDHRADMANPMDQKLLELLHQLQTKVEQQGEFHVISGFRSPATNEMLNKRSSGVAKQSYHMLGKAIDVRLPGFDTSQLKKAAIALKGGGVGYYASSNFIHLDVGRVRYW